MRTLRTLYSCWGNYLWYPGNRTELTVTSVLVLLQIISFALYHQLSGQIPTVSGVNLGFISFQFPSMSRLWDLLLCPMYLFLSWCVMTCWWLQDDDETGYAYEGVTNGMGTLVMLSLVAALLLGILFGFVYAPVAFFGAFVFFFMSAIVWALSREVLERRREDLHAAFTVSPSGKD